MKSTYLTKEQTQERIKALSKTSKTLTREQIRQRIQELAISNPTRYLKSAVEAKTRSGGKCQKHGMLNGRCRLH